MSLGGFVYVNHLGGMSFEGKMEEDSVTIFIGDGVIPKHRNVGYGG